MVRQSLTDKSYYFSILLLNHGKFMQQSFKRWNTSSGVEIGELET